MKQITITGWAYCQPAKDYECDRQNVVDGFKFDYLCIDPARIPNYTPAGTATLTIDLPEGFDPRAGAVKTLEEQRKKIQAEFQARINEIDRQISQFAAIEFVEEA